MALAALADTRNYAARLEAAAMVQQDEEKRLLAENAKLRDNIAEGKRRHSTELDVLREELAKTRARLEQVEEEKLTKMKQSHKRLRQTERLLARLKRAEAEVVTVKSELGRARVELVEARRQHEQAKLVHESQLRALRSEVSTLCHARDELIKQLDALTSKTDDPQNRTELLNQIAAAKRAYQEAHADAERFRRRLKTEQDRRIAAEKRIEQLLMDHETQKKATRPDAHGPAIYTPTAIGQYQRHAAAAGYDMTRDPLFDLMHRDVLVADCYADWQANHMLRMTSRRRDRKQTLEEQAYAATLAMRWRIIDHPHIRLGTIPTWTLLGCLLDEKSEKYLLTITTERIAEMEGRLAASR